jgi:hypothetical protein
MVDGFANLNFIIAFMAFLIDLLAFRKYWDF